jgi:hypothetical protein
VAVVVSPQFYDSLIREGLLPVLTEEEKRSNQEYNQRLVELLLSDKDNTAVYNFSSAG